MNADGTLALSGAELAQKLLELADTADGGDAKTGRRYYYLALSHGYIQPDMGATDAAKKSRNRAYKKVTDLLGTLRMMGTLPWRMVLDLTRELDEPSTFDSPREARAAMRRWYDEDRWLGQPYFPIVIVEKDTMEPVVKPHAQRWQMAFASSRGYSSLRLQYDVARMLRNRFERTHQMALVYFISDHDPSGFDLQRAWEEALENFCVEVKAFVRIGLTTEQVMAADLDLERLAIAVKPDDTRTAKYVQEHGNRCWEADILPAEVITQAIDDHIEEWLDRNLWDQRNQDIENARRLL